MSSPQQTERAFKTILHKSSALVLQQCPRSHPYFADAVKDNFEQAYSHIYCSFADEYETKFPVPIQVSGDQSINNTLVSIPVSTIQLPKFLEASSTGRTRPGYNGINRNQLFSGMEPCGKTIQQPSTAVHVQYECTVRSRATVQGDRGGPYEFVKLGKCMY